MPRLPCACLGFAHLRTVVVNGTVVLINTAERRSDALAPDPGRLDRDSLAAALSPHTVHHHVTMHGVLESYDNIGPADSY